jgi:hypothetical protein
MSDECQGEMIDGRWFGCGCASCLDDAETNAVNQAG